MGEFTYKNKQFYLNKKPIQLLSGAIHYFRTVPEYWQDRLLKLKQCGFNTVETYICWNLHEPREGEFDFTGILDLARFIDTANELGLLCIIRPGPYICAEWDFGGLPSWLLNYGNMHIRCMDKLFLEKEERYLEKIFEIIKPRLVTNGGNIIMVQVENEYGSFGNDHEYIDYLAKFYKKCGIDVPLFTSDGPGYLYYGGGTREEILSTGNFGSGWDTAFEFMRSYYPDEPTMCAEFWGGWFDNWYGPHNKRPTDDVHEQIDGMLSAGGNVNVYMFCGGTNFAFYNGANIYEKYSPTTTSYDYDALLTESGDLTERYFKVRGVAEKHFNDLSEITVKNSEKAKYGKVELTEFAPLIKNLNNISTPLKSAYAKTMEEIGVDFGFALYSTVVDYPVTEKLIIDPVRDRAIVFVNGVFKGIKERDRRDDEIIIENSVGQTTKIDILVENMGRVNYGVMMSDNKKGLVTEARIGQQKLFGWTVYPLKMKDLDGLKFESSNESNCPMFLRGKLVVDEQPKDSFVKLDGFHKGFVVINGFNIGRYWNDAGPQKTLYVPAPILKQGENTIVVFESDGFDKAVIEFVDNPEYKN